MSMRRPRLRAAATLISTVGGAAGPLYGTAFLRAAGAATGDLEADGVADVLEAGLGGIVARGRAEVGDKTMVDAWAPAVAAARAAATAGASPAAALRAAAQAAAAGAAATEPLVARSMAGHSLTATPRRLQFETR